MSVISQDDGPMRLYLEYIFSAIFIEQKRGWADIMSNAPYYRVRDPKKSTVSPSWRKEYARDIARLENEIAELGDLAVQSTHMFEKIKEIFDRYHLKNKTLKGLKSDLSDADKSLLRKFQTAFRSYLAKLGYNSYEIEFLGEGQFKLYGSLWPSGSTEIKIPLCKK